MNLDTLRRDIPAGLVVFLVALPLCLGHRTGQRITAVCRSADRCDWRPGGHITESVPVCRQRPGGRPCPPSSSPQWRLWAVFSAFLTALIIAGALQCLFGLLRAGRFISLVPGSVIKGMLAAIGLLLIMQQIPVALGAAGDAELVSLVTGEMTFSLPAVAVAGVGLAILCLWTTAPVKRIKALAWIPGPLIAVLIGCLATVVGGRLFPEMTSGLARISLPAFDSISALMAELERPDWMAWQNPQVWVVCGNLSPWSPVWKRC
ncbi:putative transporter [Pantoea agglomerans]|uniref:Putative transporter n=1 Tax=Enterobacter agglomerans TaxID=549 RepID=A0A379AAM0_ENTAG|nr:putative transporter [Pantoea agglomerans]